MMMEHNQYVKKIVQLNSENNDRYDFHKKAGEIMKVMSQDKVFWAEVFKGNLTDKGYLKRRWTMYEIPFFYIYENDDFVLKVHLFMPLESRRPDVAASAIHHHNNYLLTTLAAFGPGYETMLFEKNPSVNPATKETSLKISKQFTQQEFILHMVDAWEPHVVINPISLSATIVLWTPDEKRKTDALRSNPVLKFFKIPLLKIIYLLNLDKKLGIAAKETYQFYAHKDKFYAVLEDEFFAPTRAQDGPEVDDYSIQTVYGFMQKIGFDDKDFFKFLKSSPDLPHYYQKWNDMIINGQIIPETYAKEKINIPDGIMLKEDILRTNKKINNL